MEREGSSVGDVADAAAPAPRPRQGATGDSPRRGEARPRRGEARPRIIDVHTHAFPDALAPQAIARLLARGVWGDIQPASDGTVAGLLAGMDRAGVEQAVVCSVATRPAQVPKITDWSRAIASERLIPFASVHPDFEGPEGELERIAAAGLRGLKFHSAYMDCPLDDPRAVRIGRAAARLGLAMAVHAGYDFAFEREDLASPERVRRLHRAVPDLRMVACHMGGWRRWPDALEHVVGLPIYLETSMTLRWCPRGLFERMVERHAPELLLFGTDSPWSDPREDLARLEAVGLPPDLRRRMLWDNARRFLGLDPEEGVSGHHVPSPHPSPTEGRGRP